MARFYLHALGSGHCDLAFKFSARGGTSLRAFRRSCRAISRISVQRLGDPGYRLHPAEHATYTCLAVRYTIYRRTGPTSLGGWYLMERTPGPAWHILYGHSHVSKGGGAQNLTRSECAGHIPAYVRSSAGTIVSGSDFLSAATGWVALSTSGSYVPGGSCTHGIGANCDSAPTVVYRTLDAGHHWTPVLHVTAVVGLPTWIHFFSRQVGLFASTVGPLHPTSNGRSHAALFATRDAGRHWQRFPLPVNYATLTGSISFPDPRHGWLWYGGAAAGSMAVYIYRTVDGGRRWSRVACTAFPNPTPGYGCSHPSGIALGGDKEDLVFTDGRNGWLTASENTGIPDLYRSVDAGKTWQRQTGIPYSGGAVPGGNRSVFPSDTLIQPRFFGSIGLLPEEASLYRSTPQASWQTLYVLRSTDGGKQWGPAVRTPMSGLVDFWQAVDARHWFFVTNRSPNSLQTIWTTADGGASWSRHLPHLQGALRLVGMEMTSRREGWATAQTRGDSEVSASGSTLLRTNDGGARWTVERLP